MWSACDPVERLEHQERDRHGGADQDQQHDREARGALLVRALDVALALATGRTRLQALTALAILLDLLDEGGLDLGQALAHPHGADIMTPRRPPRAHARRGGPSARDAGIRRRERRWAGSSAAGRSRG